MNDTKTDFLSQNSATMGPLTGARLIFGFFLCMGTNPTALLKRLEGETA